MDSTKICPFCTPSIQDSSFFESHNFLAVYNIAPILPGHTLVIPKTHITSIMDLNENELFEFVRFSRQVVQILTLAFKTSSFNWTLQEKEAAGQTIAHMHIHIIPRVTDDLPEPGDWYPKIINNLDNLIDSNMRPKLSGEDIKLMVEKLKNIASGIHSL